MLKQYKGKNNQHVWESLGNMSSKKAEFKLNIKNRTEKDREYLLD